jgi:hypothetical protein
MASESKKSQNKPTADNKDVSSGVETQHNKTTSITPKESPTEDNKADNSNNGDFADFDPASIRETVLSSDDLKFFDVNGYIVVKGTVSKENCQQVVKDIWEFFEMDPPSSKLDNCYRAPVPPNSMCEMYHSQSMWDNRCCPRIYNAFADLWKRDDLWVSIDRCGVKMPSTSKFKEYQHKGFTHWDMDVTASEIPLQLQGALALEDTDITMGGFHCYPGMHLYLKQWMTEKKITIPQPLVDKFYSANSMPIKTPDHETTLKNKKHVIVPMEAGGLVIWRGEIAHGNGENKSSRVRYAQYITMFPAEEKDSGHVGRRLEIWKRKLPGGQVPYPQLRHDTPVRSGDNRQWEQKKRQPATLSDLGKLLLGLHQWPASSS